MKEKGKKIIAMFLITSIILANGQVWCENTLAAGNYTRSEVESKLNTLKSQYPAGATWNRSFAGGYQCYAFAHYVFNTIFNRGNAQVGNGAVSSNSTCYKLNNVASDIAVVGTLPPGYSDAQLEQLLESARPGDYIQVKRNSSGVPHSMIVTYVDASANKIGIFDANAVASNTVGQYSQTFSYFKQRNAGVSVYRYKGYNYGSNPVGVVDTLYGGANQINLAGWAYDADDTNANLQIHVYIGNECHALTANLERKDVHNVYGCGNYHGYGAAINTEITGRQVVRVYAINVGSGENVLLMSKEVNISKDTEKPKITRTYVSEVTRDSYRVCAEISDNSGIKNVSIATWSQGDQSDIKWRAAHYNGFGTYFIDINRSEHSQILNSLYYNHIYVYDYANNCTVGAIDMDYKISSNTGKNIPDGEYRIVTANNESKAIDAYKDGTTEGTNIEIYSNTNNKKQTFDISYVGDGFYKIIGRNSGLALDVRGDTYHPETNVMLSEYHGGANQQWMFKKCSDGVYSIIARSNGMALDVYMGNYADETNVQVYEQNGGYNQQWKLKRVLNDSMVTLANKNIYLSNYSKAANDIVVKVDGTQLKRNVDYKVESALKGSTVSYTITGIGNYCDTVVKKVTLKEEPTTEGPTTQKPTQKPTEQPTTQKPTEEPTTEEPTTKQPEKNTNVKVTGITLDKTDITIKKGEIYMLHALVLPDNATNKNVVWKTDNSQVATVSGGKVTAVGCGQAVITVTAKDGNKSAKCVVNVEADEVQSITLNCTELSMKKGDKYTLKATIFPDDAENKRITWSSENKDVASVENGIVTGLSEGTAYITAKAQNGVSAVCRVTVTEDTYQDTEYTVTFMDGNKKVDVQTVKENESAVPPNLEKQGYFLRWDKSFCEVNEDLVVNAIWYPESYEVEYDGNGAGWYVSEVLTYSEKYGDLPQPQRKGYKFSGWYTKKNGGREITPESVVDIAKDHTLYAHWKKVKVSRASIRKIYKKKNKIQICIKGVSGAQGYQIVCSEKKKFKSCRTVYSGDKYKVISNLKSGCSYYVKVRAYSEDSMGNRVYGKYSRVYKVRL